MKVLLDESVPRQLAQSLVRHEVTTVLRSGWAGAQNGVLLGLVERSGCQVFVTSDKNMEYQQHELDKRLFGLLVLSTNHWPTMRSYLEVVVSAVDCCQPATIAKVECGRFVPGKKRLSL